MVRAAVLTSTGDAAVIREVLARDANPAAVQ